MSQQAVIDVDFKDENLLLDALKDMGFKPIVHKEAVPLKTYGNRGNAKAHIILEKETCCNRYGDFGFERIDGGFKLHADHIDIKRLNLTQLKQHYTKSFIKKRIKLLGTQYIMGKDEIDQNGQMKLKIRVME
jgi:hypothetical protein